MFFLSGVYDPFFLGVMQTLGRRVLFLLSGAGLWEMTTSVIQQKGLPKDKAPPRKGGDSQKYHRSGWIKVERSTTSLRSTSSRSRGTWCASPRGWCTTCPRTGRPRPGWPLPPTCKAPTAGRFRVVRRPCMAQKAVRCN